MNSFKQISAVILVLAVTTIAAVLVSCSDDDNGYVPRGPIDPNFVDLELEVGYYCFCWDQMINDARAATGKYEIRMVAGSYDNSWDFRIRNGALRIPAHECCDTATYGVSKAYKDPPEFFSIEFGADTVAWGDTVHFEIGIPVARRVQLEIKRTGD